MKIKKWLTATPDLETARSLSTACGFSPLAAAVLCARGVDTKEKAETFLATDLEHLYDPMLLKDMDLAVQAIKDAIQKKEKIIVFGDYDVDGITSTCVLLRYLRSKGANADYYIPNRLSEGYGLSYSAMDTLYKQGVRTIVTVDSGVTALEEIEHATKLGMRVIVTDHHECREQLPVATAVVNPRRSDCDYPFDELAGVGVAFKLICAMEGLENLPKIIENYSDLVSLGTVADVMPIIGENRIIVAHGLKCMENTKNLGLEMLLRESGQKNKRLTAATISFVLAPRINAAGRMGNTEQAVELFLTDNPVRAQELAALLCEQNKQRQTAENDILEQALVSLRKNYNPLEDKIIVLDGEGWHHGVIGIVSSRLCDRYACPVILIAVDEGIGKGSGRSMSGFNLFEALTNSEQLLDKYGGHELAAGLTIKQENIEQFKKEIKQYANEHINPDDLLPVVNIDCEITPDYITEAAVDSLTRLEPFGMKNTQPIFSMYDMYVEEITPISSDKHVRLTLMKDGVTYTAMLFGTGAGGCGFAQGNFVDVAFNLEINEFRCHRTVQMILKDVKLSDCEIKADEKILSIYKRYMSDGALTAKEAQALYPDRPDLVAVWRHIISRAEEGILRVHSNALSRRIQWESKREINIGKLFVCLDVFSESQLLDYNFRDNLLNIMLKPFKGKADISKSVVLATLRSMSK